MMLMIDTDKLFNAIRRAISENIINFWGYTTITADEAFEQIADKRYFYVYSEENDKKLATVTIETVEDGFESLVNEYPFTFARIITDTANSSDIDVLFQLCCFGEVVYD